MARPSRPRTDGFSWMRPPRRTCRGARIREKVATWQKGGHRRGHRYHGPSSTLLDWTAPERDQKLFICQIEVLETAIHVTQAALDRGSLSRFSRDRLRFMLKRA